MDLVNTQQRRVLQLFERIHEPVFISKGGVVHEIPSIYWPEEFQNFDFSITSSVGDVVFHIDENVISPEKLKEFQAIPRGEPFSIFLPSHRQVAYNLVRFLKSVPTVNKLLDIAAIIRDQINENIFVFAWAAAIIQRKDTRNLRVPPVWEVFPEKFVECTITGSARSAVQRAALANQRVPIIINRTFAATDRVPENRLSYFREDMGINSHHWHWHLIFPVEGQVNKPDRRGEMFFYMHQQIVARYDAERIANGLPRVTSLHDWKQPVNEAYFSKLTTQNGAIQWGSRPAGLIPKDINIIDEGAIAGVQIQIKDLELWHTRIMDAIHKGRVLNEANVEVPLTEETGIDILGEMMEASQWSINKLFYGDLHNFGHYVLCFIHDPDRSHLENMSVMGDSVTAMRDPVFYRFHKYVDNIFQQYKATLQPYTPAQLGFNGITVGSVEVETDATSLEGVTVPTNVIVTGWQRSDLELTRGLDFASPNPVLVRMTHLQHEPFLYNIQVSNSTGAKQDVVFRIFLAPTEDETGRQLSVKEQRLLAIELDKFVREVAPGDSVVQRLSSDSSVTIPFERTFRELETPITAPPPVAGGVPTTMPTNPQVNFCGCGWPDHFLVPRGKPPTPTGMPFNLFVIATNWKEDGVAASNPAKVCTNAASYCGVLDEKYPDKRPMGFPFDRPPVSTVRNWRQFLTPNMTMSHVNIEFYDRTIRHYPEESD